MIIAGLVAAVLGGAVWGFINGLLIAHAKVPPLIVTLGSFGAALGAAEPAQRRLGHPHGADRTKRALGSGTSFGGIPNLVITAAVITLIAAWLLHTTRFGRYTFAVGSNPEAARRAGIGVTGHLMKVYLLTGLLAGAAGFMSLAYYSTTGIAAHATDNLNAIAGGGDGRHQPVRRGRHHARHGHRGVHPGRAEEGLQHHPRPGLLADDRGRRGAGRRGLVRPAAHGGHAIVCESRERCKS